MTRSCFRERRLLAALGPRQYSSSILRRNQILEMRRGTPFYLASTDDRPRHLILRDLFIEVEPSGDILDSFCQSGGEDIRFGKVDFGKG